MGINARLVALSLLAGIALAPSPAPAVAAPDRTGPAGPPTRTIQPARLPRGRDARVPFLQDGVIHADGRTIAVRVPVDGDQRQLLGESRKGWLVAVRKGHLSRVVALRPGRRPVEVRRTRATTYGEGDAAVGWLLSRDGTMLVSTLFDRGGTSYDAQDLAGRRLGSGYDGAFFTPFDADAGRVITWGEDDSYAYRVVDWTPPKAYATVARRATYASIADDLLFVRTTGRGYGPTALSAPGTPPWAEPFSPLAVSPDGATALGLRVSRSGFDSPAVLDVRRMSDGALLDSIAFGARITEDTWSITSQHEQTAAWEGNHRFVLQLQAPGGAVLVRCTLGGECRRASDVGGNISFPHESYMWW